MEGSAMQPEPEGGSPEMNDEQVTDESSALKNISVQNTTFQCVFCRTNAVDDLNLGQLFMIDGVAVHYFCMLFSAALSQHGRDDEGILGFLPQDIQAEVRRSLRLKCTFCNVAGASVGCCNRRCRTAFHFPCGLRNGANYQFFGNYESFCQEHVEPQNIHLPEKDWICPICTSQVVERRDAIMSSCCGSAVFHKECLQKSALSSGYFFKCPMCNNGKEFVHEMRRRGIFVPEQDASWEREPNAFEDLYQQHSRCDAAECICPHGKEFSATKGNWELARCRVCGASGTHKKCSGLKTTEDWACETCAAVEQRIPKKKIETVAHVDEPSVSSNGVAASDDSESVYVSARSGNRRVRNGRLHRRKANSDYWKLSDITISPSCFWFFPYEKHNLARFASQKTLPDWRHMTLQVNVVNWIPKNLFVGMPKPPRPVSPEPEEDYELHKLSAGNLTMLKAMKLPEEDSVLLSDSEIIVHYKAVPISKPKSRKKNFGYRSSKWSRGNSKKNAAKKKVKDDSTSKGEDEAEKDQDSSEEVTAPDISTARSPNTMSHSDDALEEMPVLGLTNQLETMESSEIADDSLLPNGKDKIEINGSKEANPEEVPMDIDQDEGLEENRSPRDSEKTDGTNEVLGTKAFKLCSPRATVTANSPDNSTTLQSCDAVNNVNAPSSDIKTKYD